MKNKKMIVPVDNGSSYGEILYGYTDIEEAERDYIELTGEELDVAQCSFVKVEILKENVFSWADQSKGIPSIICIY